MTYSGSALKSKVRWIIVIMYHMIVLAATALVASGGQALQGSSPTTESLTKLKAGIAILIVAWVVLVVLAILPQKPVQNETSQNAKRIGKQVRNIDKLLVRIRYSNSVSFIATPYRPLCSRLHWHSHYLYPRCLCFPGTFPQPSIW